MIRLGRRRFWRVSGHPQPSTRRRTASWRSCRSRALSLVRQFAHHHTKVAGDLQHFGRDTLPCSLIRYRFLATPAWRSGPSGGGKDNVSVSMRGNAAFTTRRTRRSEEDPLNRTPTMYVAAKDLQYSECVALRKIRSRCPPRVNGGSTASSAASMRLKTARRSAVNTRMTLHQIKPAWSKTKTALSELGIIHSLLASSSVEPHRRQYL